MSNLAHTCPLDGSDHAFKVGSSRCYCGKLRITAFLTPGEWTVEHSDVEQPVVMACHEHEFVWPLCFVEAPDISHLAGTGGVPGVMLPRPYTSPQAEADASLFAGSKDLITVAIAIEAEFDGFYDLDCLHVPIGRAALERLRAAIAKVEGQ